MGYRKRTVRNTGEITDEGIENVPEDVPEAEVENTAEIPDVVMKSADDDAVMKRKLEIAEKRRASLALARSKIIPKSQLKKQVADATKVVEEVAKSKDEVIRNKQEETDAMRLKYERDRVKQLEDSLFTLQKLIVERPMPIAETKSEPVAVAEKPKYKRPSRAKSAVAERVVEKPSQQTERGSFYETKHDVPSRLPQQPQQIIPKKSVEPRITRPVPTETLIDKSYGEQLQERLRTQAINKIMSDTFGGF
jgi:hypothetical protein